MISLVILATGCLASCFKLSWVPFMHLPSRGRHKAIHGHAHMSLDNSFVERSLLLLSGLYAQRGGRWRIDEDLIDGTETVLLFQEGKGAQGAKGAAQRVSRNGCSNIYFILMSVVSGPETHQGTVAMRLLYIGIGLFTLFVTSACVASR